MKRTYKRTASRRSYRWYTTGLALIGLLLSGSPAFAQGQDEGSEEKSSTFWRYFGPHEPIYAALGAIDRNFRKSGGTFSQFQLSFRYELFDFYSGERPNGAPSRGFNLAYTQTSFWDLSSQSQPFFDTSYKPSLFFLYQQLGGLGKPWAHRLDLEAGLEHHSNGQAGANNRFLNTAYIKPTIVWRLFGWSYFFVAPKVWTYFLVSKDNADIQDYWGNLDLELTWRTDFGLQLETHLIPATNVTTFQLQATYPLSRLWRPLNFYFLVDYRSGAAPTILRYGFIGSSFIFGIALTR